MSSMTLQDNVPMPFSSGIINRPRLIDKLHAAIEYKLTLISAPPGYGKTTLASQYVRQARCPVAWQTVEERDRDLPNLYNRCIAALEAIAPGIRRLPSPHGYPPNELAALVTDYLRDNVNEDVVYLLDDVQKIAGALAAETWLREFVVLLPRHVHLVIISRMLPDLPLAEMIARREVQAIGQEQLRLTPHEVYFLAHETQTSAPSISDVHKLVGRLEGWPAGIALALQPLPSELERAMLEGGEGPEALFDALANSMLQAQPPLLREFLLASSTLRRLTAELGVNALGLSGAAEWLVETQIRNLFLSKAPDGLFYHTLFRNFLQRQLKKTAPERFYNLHVKAARWFEETGDLEEAFAHYMDAGLYERAAALGDRVATSFFAQGKTESLIRWHSELREVNASAPRLAYVCAVIHTDRYEYDQAEMQLDLAEQGFEELQDSGGIADVWLQRAQMNLQRGRYHKAVEQATAVLEQPGIGPSHRGRALKIFGTGHLRLGDAETAMRHLEEAVPLHRADGDAYTLANVLQDLGVAYERMGKLDSASACLQEVVALRRSLGSAGALALALNNLGYSYHCASDYHQARATYREGLNVLARVPYQRAQSYLLWSLADLERDLGVFDEATKFYNQALDLAGVSEPTLRCTILISLATLRRWEGHYADSAALSQEAVEIAEHHGAAVESAYAQAALWAARASLGESSEALMQLDAISRQLQQQGARIELLRALAMAAAAALLCGEHGIASSYLQNAVHIANQIGTAQPLAAEVEHTPTLLAFVSANLAPYGILARDLKRLQEVRAKAAATVRVSGHPLEQQTYSLRVRTLGFESIERDGVRLSTSEWRATSARELFLYLLFFGPETRERISLAFWPDSSLKRVRSNFHTTLYRARQALGENVIMFVDDLYQINPDIDLWCDAHELQTLTKQARLLPPRDARTEDLWRRAVDLYRGDFLPSLDPSWVIPLRESLREAYLEALIGLGECARARNDLHNAVNAFKRALEEEPYREDIHRSIMMCYAQMGERKLILGHLQTLEELLDEELGVEPSEETVALARRLLE